MMYSPQACACPCDRGIHLQHVLICSQCALFASTLQDEEFLYLVMEYLPGGDVMVGSTTDRHGTPQHLSYMHASEHA
jgi:hypothetical protein